MSEDPTDLSHPDAIIRLVSTGHRFQCPAIGNKKLSYMRAFKSVAGPHPKAKDCMEKADAARTSLSAALAGFRTGSSSGRTESVSYESVASAAKDYVPLVQQILLSCEVQADTALLDERLSYEWTSGVEAAKQAFKSEALAYELSMAIACEGLGNAGMGFNDGGAGNFVVANKQYKIAAGQFEYLAQDQLPKWIARGTDVEAKGLPCETTLGVCEALKIYYLACAQQMAVATVLAKPDAPNCSLLAKLCLGIAEQLDQAVATFNSKAAAQGQLLEKNFFAMVKFQTAVQRALSLYFLARSHWESDEYGLAIGLINEAVALARALPDTGKKSPLHHLADDVNKFKVHLNAMLDSWDKDNKSIYFDSVPRPVPQAQKLAKGMVMMKPEKYTMTNVGPVPLYKTEKKGFLW